jgi:hypothetical protein
MVNGRRDPNNLDHDRLTHLANPKGLKESSRWSESAETTGKYDINWVAPQRGARSFDVKIFYVDL